MRYKTFGNDKLPLSELAVGTWSIGAGGGYGEVDDRDSIAAIRAMLDGGVNLIDTAPAYGGGYAERICGEAIRGLDRSQFYLSTKFGNGGTTLSAVRGGPSAAGTGRDSSFASVVYECEQSLRRLGTDYIDFYFVHWPDPKTPYDETMEALLKLREQGKVRWFGLSNVDERDILAYGETAPIDAIQPPYSMVVRRDEGLMKWCEQNGIANFTYGTLGAGILTGAFREAPTFAPGDPRIGFYHFFNEPHFSKVMRVLDVMDGIAAETGRPLAQIALNWSTSRSFVTTALVGVRNPREAEENLAAFDWQLTAEQRQRLDDAIETYIDFDGSSPLPRGLADR